jgi:hypothetical protein
MVLPSFQLSLGLKRIRYTFSRLVQGPVEYIFSFRDRLVYGTAIRKEPQNFQSFGLATKESTQTMNRIKYVGFEILTAVSTKMAVFWVAAPCSLVEVYLRFRGPCCLHHQGDDGGIIALIL